jgi:hypothetical protein
MGGFDLFSSKVGTDGEWTKPENMGYPLNTVDDDVFFQPMADGRRAYYSSQKDGVSNVTRGNACAMSVMAFTWSTREAEPPPDGEAQRTFARVSEALRVQRLAAERRGPVVPLNSRSCTHI